jgi:ComF family protein
MIAAIKPEGILKGLSHLFYPRLCEGCRKPLVDAEEIVCLGCETHLSLTNYHDIAANETALRLYGRVPFKYATSLVWFTSEGLVQHLVHGLKYKGRTQTGIYLGRKLGKAIKAAGWAIDAVVPVPLHRKKEHKRGYNQSALIAEGVAEVMQIPVVHHAVSRIRDTETQTEKTRAERIDNVAMAFAIRKPELLKGKHILLVDDVLTTGATIESCSLEILTVPNVTVSIATIGIATS